MHIGSEKTVIGGKFTLSSQLGEGVMKPWSLWVLGPSHEFDV